MLHTFLSTANSTATATALGEAGQDIRVFKLLFGNPVDAGTFTLYNKAVAYTGDTGNWAFKLTQPSHAAGADWVREVDFGEKGLPLDGGCFHMTEDQAVTIIWDREDSSGGGQ